MQTVDTMLLTETCNSLNNFFIPLSKRDEMAFIHRGTFTIEDGGITGIDFLKEGQYFRIVGSDLNDGVYQNTTESLATLDDEVFTGSIWEMSIPKSFLNLIDDIQAYRAKMDELSQQDSGFSSESFGGYSYSINSTYPPYLQEWTKRINV